MFQSYRLNKVNLTTIDMQMNFFEKIKDSSFEGCLLQDNFLLLISNVVKKQSTQWITLKENILSNNLGLILRRDQFASPIFNEKINQFIGGGFFNQWMYEWTKSRYVIEKPPEPEPVILNMNHMEIGFVIWLLMLFLSSAVFLGEILHSWSPQVCKTFLVAHTLENYFRDFRNLH